MLSLRTSEGHYEFHVHLDRAKPQLCSLLMMRMMRNLQQPLNNLSIINFMDYILVATETIEEHLPTLESLFQRLTETDLTARPNKCLLTYQQLELLGHTVTQGYRSLDSKNENLKQSARPQTKKLVQSFVSLCDFYRIFYRSCNGRICNAHSP